MLRNLSNPFCNMLHRTTACHTICHVLLCSVNIYLLELYCSASPYWPRWSSSDAAATTEVLCVTFTSPRGPGSPIRPVRRSCTACRRTPGCCADSEPRSSGTPDSSCPKETCSTTHQPPSHLTLCHLQCTKKSLLELISRAIKRSERKTNTPPSVFLCRSKNGLNLLLRCSLVAAGVCGNTAVAIIGLKINDWLKPDLSGASTKWEGAGWFHHYQNHPRIHHYCHVY